MQDIAELGAGHLAGVLDVVFEHGAKDRALVVFDRNCELACALTDSYRRCLPHARFLDFEHLGATATLAAFDDLRRGDLVVLIQSTSFRLDEFRIRVELFRRGLKVIEHPHLERMGGDEARIYMHSLAYDPHYYRVVGPALKARLDSTAVATLSVDELSLVYPAGLEPAKLNVGDYRGMTNIGGQYPIGEVFTESRVLDAVHGSALVAFFGDTSFRVNRPPRPITIAIENGQIIGTKDSTPEFDRVLAGIRSDEGAVHVRELGFGLNRAFSHERTVSDIGTFERMCGVHLSLGLKHNTYSKDQVDRRVAKHHVDVFLKLDDVLLDGQPVLHEGAWGP